jgi:hypothetical protein
MLQCTEARKEFVSIHRDVDLYVKLLGTEMKIALAREYRSSDWKSGPVWLLATWVL